MIKVVNEHKPIHIYYLCQNINSIEKLNTENICLIAIEIPEWKEMLAPDQSKYKQTQELVHQTFKTYENENTKAYITGYSLAGLFSLLNADDFDGFASVSGSLWYPDITIPEYHHKLIYMSLGKEEAKTRNKLFKQIKVKTDQFASVLSQDNNVLYELNEGDHFFEHDKRMQKAIDYFIKRS